jgi:nucleotide-binding universal stress UspA family protein
MLKRILVALSGTPYTESAIQHALALADAHDADVTGVTVTDLSRLANVGPIPIGAAAAAHDLAEHRIHVTEERISEAIAKFQTACGVSGVGCTVDREAGDPTALLRSASRYNDITIFGLRGLFEYGVVHNPDDLLTGLIKHGVRPILAVAQEPRLNINRALVAYSGSMESAKAMKRFVQTRPWGDVAMHIASFDRKRSEADVLLADAASYCRAHGFEVETEYVDDRPSAALFPCAEANAADIIVMGSTSRTRLFQHMLGDLVLRAVRESPIPLYLTQ